MSQLLVAAWLQHVNYMVELISTQLPHACLWLVWRSGNGIALINRVKQFSYVEPG